MVSREFIYSKVKSRQVIAVHMKGEERWDGLTRLIYVIIDLILDKEEEELLKKNINNKVDTNGALKIKATRTSEIDTSLEDPEPKEYVINTTNIASYEQEGCVVEF